ncbi:MAG: cytochrome c oxidase assembly protein [Candidatus Limnocylindrales bacterium]
MRALVRPVLAISGSLGLLALALAGPPLAVAHVGGDLASLPPLGPFTALTTWAFDPLVTIAVLVPLVAYLAAVRRVNAQHPANPVPLRRVAAWVGGLAVLAIALCSSIDVYSGVLFSVHMVQHMLLVFLVAPLLCLGAPVTLLLRVATPEQRTRRILPILHSRLLTTLTHPLVDWLLFTAVMWGAHFSPLFELALENPWVHIAEHALFLLVGFLFWWPVIGADPGPRPMAYPTRVGYVLLQMPQNAFLGLTLFTATQLLYPYYGTVGLAWLPDPLVDQHLGGGLMWVAGDLMFLVPVLLVVVAWLHDEERRGRLYDEQLARRQSTAAGVSRGGPG